MDAEPRNDGRSDPLTALPDCGDAGDFARWEAGGGADEDYARWCGEGGANCGTSRRPGSREAAERRGTLAALDDHRSRFVAAGGGRRRFDDLHLLPAARAKAGRTVDLLTSSRGARQRPATEHEVRIVLTTLAGQADAARETRRLRAFRRRLWPFGPPPDD